jgi:serine/threonine-protein kinase HipA
VLDLGCGPGRQTLVLARELGAPITAIDLHAPFLAELSAAAAAQGLASLVKTRAADFGALDDPPGSVDLLWSEGAIYVLGFAEGLRRFRPLLHVGSAVALSEATWLTEDPPEEPAAFWREAYPTMGTIASNCEAAERAGYAVRGTIVAPASAWWDDYYGPLNARIEALRHEASSDPDLARAIADTEREIALYARFGDTYGYVFYLLHAR